MPKCNHCNYELDSLIEICPNCNTEQKHDFLFKNNAVDVEVLSYTNDKEDQYRQSFNTNSSNKRYASFWQVHGRGWRKNNFNNGILELSSLPIVITMVLGIALFIQLGFLACLGYFFFYILGSAFATGITVRRTLMGKSSFLWFNRVIVWTISYALAYSLAT